MFAASWHLAPRPVQLHTRTRCPRLSRTQHAPSRVRRGVQRLAAEPRQLAGSGLDENELRTLLLRLREDDVEYFDLKAMCKERQLGGRDSKDNLRAKLLRRVRQDLGMPVFGPDNVQPADVCPPQSMNSEELRQLFASRDCMMPASRSQILAMANALLIADGLLTPEQAVWPQSSDGSWASLSAVKLRQACVVRGLPSKGLRKELVKRLEAHDAAAAAAAAAPDDPPAADAPAADPTPAAEAPVEVPAEAAAEEVFSGAGSSSDEEGRELGAVPAPSNTSQLQAAQDMWAGLKRMDVGGLREELQRRGLKSQGTKQVLMAKLTEALEGDVAAALGGEQRLARWAASAVGRMGEADVAAELAARDVDAAQYQSLEAAAAALQAVMQRDWVAEALQAGQAQQLAQQQAQQQAGGVDDAGGWETAMDAGRDEGSNGGDAGGYGAGGGEQLYGTAPLETVADAAAQQWVWGRPGDPALTVALLVGGHTHLQRDAALAAARLAAQLLQSDRSQGLLPRPQLEAGEGGERSGIAVRAYYVAADGSSPVPLTWEQLHAASAAELDARLALQEPPDAASAAAVLETADVVLPLGLPPPAASLLEAGAGKVAGSAADTSAAALASDRLAFTAAAAQLGFATVPALRLQLADFGDAGAAESLSDLAVCQRIQAFAEEQLAGSGCSRLAVRVEVAGSVLGGGLASGPGEVVLSALALMQEHCVSEVIVEAVRPGAHHFTCSVLSGPGGVVALPPTEFSYWDVEDDIAEAEWKMQQWLAAQEGVDEEVVAALLELMRQEQLAHPALLGGAGSQSQQLRQSTPPASLTAEATQALRHASVKLFQELGLRDYAQFSGWLLPQQPKAAPASVLEAALEQQQQCQEKEEAQVQQRRGKSFAELEAIDAAARAEAAAAAASAPANDDSAAAAAAAAAAASISSDDREGATDTTAGYAAARSAAEQDVALTSGAAAAGGSAAADYGSYLGFAIDDSVRQTADSVLVEGAQFGRPIPTPTPPPVVTALEDLSEAAPTQLCQLRSGQTVAFALLGVTPDLGSPTSVLCQQAAAVGLSYEALLRHLVSAASLRAGGPSLPPLPQVTAAEAAAAAAAEAARRHEDSEEAGWTAFGATAPFDQAGIRALVEPEFQWDSWLPRQAEEEAAASGGEEGGERAPAFDFVDATSDPSLDPVAILEAEYAAEMAAQAEADALVAPLGYDDIRSGVAWDSPAAQQQQQGGGSGAAPLAKQRVWVLLGGDGARRTESLQAGLHAYLSLRTDPELEVEAFMLEPSRAGLSEVEVRRRLLDKRVMLMQLGLDEDEIKQGHEFSDLSRIRHPPPHELVPRNLGVWHLSGSSLLRAEVEDLQCACEAALATANMSLDTLEQAGGDIRGMQLSVARQELGLAGLVSDGSAWGHAEEEAEDPARLRSAQYMWAEDFVLRAAARGAVVFLALGGQPAAHGPLQRLLEEANVAYTGSTHMAAEVCADKAMLIEQLLDLSSSGISTAPQQKISLPELSAQCRDEESAERLFEQLRTGLGAGPVSLTIKPSQACSGLGAMRATSGADLLMYAQAVEEWAPLIPGSAVGGGADTRMPVPPPSQFVVEPYILTEPVRVVRDVDGSLIPPASLVFPDACPADPLAHALHWPAASSSEWLAVSAVLLGAVGRMRCLGPSVRVMQLQEAPAHTVQGSTAATLLRAQLLALADEAAAAEAQEEEEEAAELRETAEEAAEAAAARPDEPLRMLAGAFHLTPPPATIASEQAVANARTRFEMVADRLGLSGAAEVSGYMQVETGEVVVSDISTTPDLSPGALIFRQAAAAEAPLSPAEVLQELIRVGMTQSLDDLNDLQALGYPELEEEAADFNFPQEAGFAPYPSNSYADVAEDGGAQYGGQYDAAQQQW